MLFVWGYEIVVNRAYELYVSRERKRVAPLDRRNLYLYIICGQGYCDLLLQRNIVLFNTVLSIYL
jgi:hypothetical protein